MFSLFTSEADVESNKKIKKFCDTHFNRMSVVIVASLKRDRSKIKHLG